MTILEAALVIFCRHRDPACVAAVTRHVPMIAGLADSYGVPPVLAVAVCAQESQLLTVRARSLCGTSGGDPETSATIATDALAGWYHRCRAWDGALRIYRYGGRCTGPDPEGYVAQVRAIERRFRCAMRTGRRC